MCSFFFFKQKTAYEMRISDWSSDVCSSDLPSEPLREDLARCPFAGLEGRGRFRPHRDQFRHPLFRRSGRWRLGPLEFRKGTGKAVVAEIGLPPRIQEAMLYRRLRSEEHTSELQSLMRNSYAVFCLKKKKSNNKPV